MPTLFFTCDCLHVSLLTNDILQKTVFLLENILYFQEIHSKHVWEITNYSRIYFFPQANVAPILKKGSKLQAVNYRPVSLTCITCKLFEHILAHLEDNNFFTDLQHGFRSGRSCETQLVITFQDLAQMHNKKGSQIDIAVSDFSKAFDTVPHDGHDKLKHYDIDEKILLWIYNFLKNRKQSVVVDGKQSSLIDVVSSLPQGTLLGPLLFLLHINDLP